MSDQEWIDRVQKSRPEDLSPGDREQLRDRSRRSPAVRKAVADEVRLDQALYATLGNAPLSSSQVAANARRSGTSSQTVARIGGVVASLFALILALLLGSACVAGAATLMTYGARQEKVPSTGPRNDKLLQSPDDPRLIDDGSSPSDLVPSVKPREMAAAPKTPAEPRGLRPSEKRSDKASASRPRPKKNP